MKSHQAFRLGPMSAMAFAALATWLRMAAIIAGEPANPDAELFRQLRGAGVEVHEAREGTCEITQIRVPVTGFRQPGFWGTDEDLLRISEVSLPFELAIDCVEVRTNVAKKILANRSISDLILAGPIACDEILVNIPQDHPVESIVLSTSGGVTDVGLIHLAGLKRLRHLRIFSSGFTGKGTAALVDDGSIRNLTVTISQLSASDLKKLLEAGSISTLKLVCYGCDEAVVAKAFQDADIKAESVQLFSAKVSSATKKLIESKGPHVRFE